MNTTDGAVEVNLRLTHARPGGTDVTLSHGARGDGEGPGRGSKRRAGKLGERMTEHGGLVRWRYLERKWRNCDKLRRGYVNEGSSFEALEVQYNSHASIGGGGGVGGGVMSDSEGSLFWSRFPPGQLRVVSRWLSVVGRANLTNHETLSFGKNFLFLEGFLVPTLWAYTS